MGSPAAASADLPLRARDDLLALFHSACKPPEQFAIGAEAEKFGVEESTGRPLPFEGDWSVARVLEALARRHAWTPQAEYPGGPEIALVRGRASITLEPGGQLELSGAPLPDAHAVSDELGGHIAELRDISAELGVAWLGIGFHPFAKQSELSWVPKLRYGVMQRYLPTRGAYGLDMMRRTATVQANFDYSSEAHAMRSLRLALRLSPLVTAMFANSPLVEGELFGGASYRARVWLDVEPARQGLVRGVLEGSGTFDDYVEWALDAPMFLVKRGSRILENTGQPFRRFLADGFEGERATFGDWETHLNTLFPEVRLKRTIEVRGADSLPLDLACALPALWTGILYDDTAFAEAERLAEGWSHDELAALRPAVADHGLRATFRGAPLVALAERLVQLSAAGLTRRRRLDRRGRDESVYLDPLHRLVTRGMCPADRLAAELPPHPTERRAAVIARARL
jgi:glutamate--cysteine ligase